MKTTGLFAAAAALSVSLAWVFRPTTVVSEGQLAEEKRGSAIFPDFNPDSAASLKIAKFDEQLATLSRIELARDAKTQLWTLPSADGYPADSEKQVSEATAPLVELTVLSTVSTDRGDHALYGVVEPNEQELTASASGVGMLVQVGGPDNQILASLIVGKPVTGTEDQHYVRVPAEDAVYVVQIKKDAFSTNFEKWIKGDILNMRSMDIENIGLRDYAIVRTERGFGLGRNFDADLLNKDSKWSLQKFVDYTVEGNPETNQPPEGKSLQESALNDLRNSIQNLKIVNVRRKPLGLAADLKADKSLSENAEATKNLQSQGFFPMESGDVYASGGELLLGTKEGVRYLLRFGNTQVSGSALTDEQEGKSENESEEKSDDQGVRRYLLVMAQLDESKFPAPELKVVPETVEEMLAQEAAAQPAAQDAPAADPSADPAQPAAQPQSGDAASGQNSDSAEESDTSSSSVEPSTSDEKQSETQQPSEPSAEATTQPATDSAPQPSAEPATAGTTPGAAVQKAGFKFVSFGDAVQEDASTSAPSAVQEPAQPQTGDEVKAEGDQATDTAEQTQLNPSRQETPEELKERLEFLQESIRKENQRLIDARNESLNQGRKKVAELNARFADWYYIVSDSVYQKLKVSRDQLFKSPEQSAPAAGQSPAGELPGLPPGLGLPSGE
ncbi:MAG TPA: hypothetical protein DCF63_06235 [Planctomycetaceae bacterium]|nr:hypothetical protein [Planctomycetaceae bacterium]